jgi:flagellar motor component MotA
MRRNGMIGMNDWTKEEIKESFGSKIRRLFAKGYSNNTIEIAISDEIEGSYEDEFLRRAIEEIAEEEGE